LLLSLEKNKLKIQIAIRFSSSIDLVDCIAGAPLFSILVIMAFKGIGAALCPLPSSVSYP
jgi:hypothetical protein